MPEIKAAAAIHSQRHAAGGPDPITPDDIGAPDVEQVSGTVDSGGSSISFGPGQAVSNGAAVETAITVANTAYTNALAAAPKEHAAQHATGGSDPITPADIGAAPLYLGSTGPAMPVESGSYTGHADEQTVPGVYRLASGAVTEANGYPPTPDNTGTLVVQTSFSSAYLIQTVYSNRNEAIWTRSRVANAWRPWVQYQTVQDTGWRDVSSLADPASFDFTTTVPGDSYLRWRRIGSTVHLHVRVPLAEGMVGTNAADRRNGLIGSFSSLGVPASSYTAVGYVDISSAIMCSLSNSSTSGRLDAQPIMATGTISSTITQRILGGKVSWLTDAPWPTTLPGTPA